MRGVLFMKKKLKLRKEIKAFLYFILLCTLVYGALNIIALRFASIYG